MMRALSIALLLAACDGGEAGRDGGGAGMDSGGVDSGGVVPGVDGGCERNVEICGDFMDQNCDGRDTSCGDTDLDGVQACRAGEAPPDCDCDDANNAAYPPRAGLPGAIEQCDGVDNDCNGRFDEAAACCTGCSGMGTRGDICSTSGACVCSTNAGMALCPVGQTCCTSGCVDTQNDRENCGGCDAVCTREADSCTAGGCTCGTAGPCDNNCTCTSGACGAPCNP